MRTSTLYITENRRVSDSRKVPAQLGGRAEPRTQSEPRSRASLHATELYDGCEGSVEKVDFLFVALWSFYRTTEKCFSGVLTKQNQLVIFSSQSFKCPWCPGTPPLWAYNSFATSHFLSRPNTPNTCLLYTSPSPRDRSVSRMPSSA